MNIKVVMTTYNRIELLTKCVDSLLASDCFPRGIEVFDDRSADPIQSEITRLPDASFHINELHIGCDGNTPYALGYVFQKYEDCDHIVVLDSDLAVRKDWWLQIKKCVFLMENDSTVAAIQALNLDNIGGKTASQKCFDMLECKQLSGCGLIVSRKFYYEFVVKQERNGWRSWDVVSTHAAHDAGMKLYTLKESAMQHLGNIDGLHNGAGQVASTFIEKRYDVAEKYTGQNVYLIAGENFCDIALAIMAAKIVAKSGYNVFIVNYDREWCSFVREISGNKIGVYERRMTVPLADGRYNVDAKSVKQQFNGATVINMETAADENKWVMYSCEGNVTEFIIRKLASCIGVVCELKDFDWPSLQCEDKTLNLSYQGKSIGNHTIVNNYEGDKDKIKTEIEALTGIVKFWEKERPGDGSWRNTIYRLSPLMVVKALNTAGTFVSAMNKSSFVSLFCTCKKFIYDKAEKGQPIIPGRLVNKTAGKAPPIVIKWPDKYDKINLMVPTRGRAKTMLPKFISSACSTISGLGGICFTFCVNVNDKETRDFLKKNVPDNMLDIIYEDLPAPHLAKFFNMMYVQTRFRNPRTMVSMLGDDMEFITPDWDKKILDAINEMGGRGIVYCDDDYYQHEHLCVNLFSTRPIVDASGKPFMCEMFPADYIDNVWMEVGKATGTLRYLADVKIRHNHSSKVPAAQQDDTYRRLRSVATGSTRDAEKYIKEAVDGITGNIQSKFPTIFQDPISTESGKMFQKKVEKAIADANSKIPVWNVGFLPPLEWMNMKAECLGKKKVISFSLWGSNPMYLRGAIENAKLQKEIYPDWQCWFYVDSLVDPAVIAELTKLDSKVIIMKKAYHECERMFWRFNAVSEPGVERAIIRDTDSRLNIREAAAVEQWEHSPFPFHIMRDNPAHCIEILGGMWGCVGGWLTNIPLLIKMWFANPHRCSRRGEDQSFLADVVWPFVKNNHLAHDNSKYITGKEVPFAAELSDGEFAGQQWDENNKPIKVARQ